MTEQAEEFIPTRRSLLTRLKRWDDEEGWGVFFNTYRKLIYSVAFKAGLADAEAQEVVQETLISVARQMRDFKYDPARGSFKSWLLQLTRRRIADQFRKRPRETCLPAAREEPTTRTAAEARIPDPAGPALEAIWNEEWRKNFVGLALESVKARVNPRQYQIFELYALKEWPVDRITRTLGVTASQVYLARCRVGNQLKREIQKLEAQRSPRSGRERNRRGPPSRFSISS